MKKFQAISLAVAATVIIIGAGCKGGAQGLSKPMDEQDAKEAIANMTPENRIKAIASSPLPQAAKDKEYAEIEAATGVKAADVLAGRGGTAPGAAAAPAKP